MNEINETMCFSLHPDIAWTLIDDEAVVMGIENDDLYSMNDVATEILKCLASSQTLSVQELIDYISKHFEVDNADYVTEIKAFIQSMLTLNLVIQGN